MELLELVALGAAVFWCVALPLRAATRFGRRRGHLGLARSRPAAAAAPIGVIVDEPAPVLPASVVPPALVGSAAR